MKKILITGASGFIGSFIVEEALRRGFDVYAAVRKTTNRQYLTDERIKFVELDISSKEALLTSMNGMAWDYVVHAAGATKCLRREDFFRTNTYGTQYFAEALTELETVPEKFIFISSLSAFGAVREQQPYTEILDTDTPQPNTAYGESKMRAEEILDAMSDKLNVVTLRPTGVYGPREKDYFLMADSIKKHVDFAVGYKPQEITFVYVQDLVNAVFLAIERGQSGKKYFISDGNVYRSTDFSDLIRKELGNPFILRIKAPVWFLRLVCMCGEKWAKLTGRITALNNDKFNILKQRNWRCDITPAMNDLGYKPEYDLKRGVHLAIEWYKKAGWL
ncbi:MAG: NAD(P)-dependent oxidoreductase [Prevotellaceae bacterium]|nr:NAD(P)-dependent oxidoreductase [Prevotellaceae bacterium]